jgi:structural maintenance of chromosome 3 (chondroitin sulfate proteoglycan 6)
LRECKEQQATIEKCQDDLTALKAQRDELQEARKYVLLFPFNLIITCLCQVSLSFKSGIIYRKLWKKENDTTSDIEKLKAEIMKAEKNLDHAAPGVWLFSILKYS